MSSTGPALVMVIRHGEKLGDPTDDTDRYVNLSIRGSSRAAAIPSLFDSAPPGWECIWSVDGKRVSGTYHLTEPKPVQPRFPLPGFLFATKPSGSSNRPVETITPLSVALGLTIDAKHADKDYVDVATDILSHPKYVNKVVLVCWHHGKIPDLARYLGAQNVPAKWDGTVFDRVWSIPFKDGAAGALEDAPQQLLYGDSSQ